MFQNIFGAVMHERGVVVHLYCGFFYLASDGATVNRQIPDCFFGQFFTSLRKDSVTNYAWIWTLFSPSVRRLDVLYNALKFRSSVGRWRHNIRKFAAEIFQNAKKIGRRVVPYGY